MSHCKSSEKKDLLIYTPKLENQPISKKNILFFNIFSLALLVTWLLPQSSFLWEQLDRSFFLLCNHSLTKAGMWREFWGWMNHRSERYLTPFFLVGVHLYSVYSQPPKKRLEHTSSLFFYWIILQSLIVANWFLYSRILHYHRLSPTLIFDSCARLSLILEAPYIRDASSSSFPSGHAYVFSLWAGITCWICHKRLRIFACFFAGLASLPRLVAGGHWATDVIFGTLTALCFLSWVILSPLSFWGPRWILFCLERCVSSFLTIFRNNSMTHNSPQD